MKNSQPLYTYPHYQQNTLSQRQFQKLLEPLSLFAFATDLEGLVVYASPNSEQLLGYKPEELTGKPLTQFLNIDYHEAFGVFMEQTIRSSGARNFESRLHGKNGYSFPALWKAEWDAADKLFYGTIQDITEQKATASLRELQKQKLIHKHQQIEEILERITNGFYALDKEWRITYVNTRAGQILDIKREQYIGRIIWECFPELLNSVFEEQYRKAMSEHKVVHFEIYLPHFANWFEINLYPSDTGLSIFFSEIGERIKVEEERMAYKRKIEQQNEKLINILERINQGFMSLDKNFRITYWNKRAEAFYGIPKSEVAGKEILSLYEGEARHFYSGIIQKLIKEGPSLHEEYICPQHNIWTELSIYPSDEGYSVFFKNIDDRKRAEVELRRLSHLAKETTNPVWIMDRDKTITWINDAFTRVWGYTSEEAVGRQAKDLLRGPETNLDTIRQMYTAMEEGKEFRGELTNYTKNRDMLYVQTICQPVFDENGVITQYFTLNIDLTDRRQLEAELQAQQNKIQAAVIAAQEGERAQLGQELHDNVNQVLTTVKLYTELCRDGIGNTSEMMNKSVRLLQESIDEIRSLSKRLSAPSLGSIRLKDSVKELADAVADTHKVNITLKAEDIDCLDIAHEVHLGVYRILQEQFTNILKHAEATQVDIRLDVHDRELVIHVRDNGKGFDTKKKTKGIGIVNMAQRANALNGKLHIITAPGAGCELVVRLPVG